MAYECTSSDRSLSVNISMKGSWYNARKPSKLYKRNARVIRERPCVVCNSPPPSQCDHVVGYATAKRLGWPIEVYDGIDNLQPLCSNCHAMKTKAQINAAKKNKSKKQMINPITGYVE